MKGMDTFSSCVGICIKHAEAKFIITGIRDTLKCELGTIQSIYFYNPDNMNGTPKSLLPT